MGFTKEDLRYVSKDELKAKIGNMKISKTDLSNKWEEYEGDRKDKIAKILEVSYNIFIVYLLMSFLGKEEVGNRVEES